MISAIIVDDEEYARGTLRSILQHFFPEISVIAEADSPVSAIDLLKRTTPDLVFLDVEMQYGTGFDVLEALKGFTFQVIFVTAHKELGYKSFRFSAIDYLIKPVRIAELKEAIEKYKRVVGTKEEFPSEDDKGKESNDQYDPKKLIVSNLHGAFVIGIEEIIRMESDKNYTHIHLSSGKLITATKPLKEYELLLQDKGFVRVHRSHLVNSSFVIRCSKGRLAELEMSDGTVIPISRDKKEILMKNFIGGFQIGLD